MTSSTEHVPQPEVIETHPDVTLIYHGDLCIHNRYCVLNRPDVFVPNVVGPWLHPELATVDEIRRLALACPSGAIQYKLKNAEAGTDEAPPMVNTLTVRENGPYALNAEAEIVGHGQHIRATLCRCGHSKNKPFCDNSHLDIHFDATGEAPTVADKPLDNRAGPVSVKCTANGPYVVTGSLEVLKGTGHTIARTSKTYLCRCGHSGNKPFCDGSHAKAGFQAPE